VVSGGSEFERHAANERSWMTADANAAIAGAREGGATEIVIADSTTEFST